MGRIASWRRNRSDRDPPISIIQGAGRIDGPARRWWLAAASERDNTLDGLDGRAKQQLRSYKPLSMGRCEGGSVLGPRLPQDGVAGMSRLIIAAVLLLTLAGVAGAANHFWISGTGPRDAGDTSHGGSAHVIRG